MRRCLKGDADAIRTLVDEFHVAVYGLCVRLLTHRHDAEDITQEVFLRIFRSLRRWDPSRPLKPWIMGITVNRCRTFLTQRSRRPEPVNYLHDVAAKSVPEDANELLHEIQRVLAGMRSEFREVFVLFHLQGQSYEDIAEALDCPLGTVKTWLHRARVEVLQHLRQRGMVDPEEPAQPQRGQRLR